MVSQTDISGCKYRTDTGDFFMQPPGLLRLLNMPCVYKKMIDGYSTCTLRNLAEREECAKTEADMELPVGSGAMDVEKSGSPSPRGNGWTPGRSCPVLPGDTYITEEANVYDMDMRGWETCWRRYCSLSISDHRIPALDPSKIMRSQSAIGKLEHAGKVEKAHLARRKIKQQAKLTPSPETARRQVTEVAVAFTGSLPWNMNKPLVQIPYDFFHHSDAGKYIEQYRLTYTYPRMQARQTNNSTTTLKLAQMDARRNAQLQTDARRNVKPQTNAQLPADARRNAQPQTDARRNMQPLRIPTNSIQLWKQPSETKRSNSSMCFPQTTASTNPSLQNNVISVAIHNMDKQAGIKLKTAYSHWTSSAAHSVFLRGGPNGIIQESLSSSGPGRPSRASPEEGLLLQQGDRPMCCVARNISNDYQKCRPDGAQSDRKISYDGFRSDRNLRYIGVKYDRDSRRDGVQ